jgi:trans-aconitate methyltransferase
MLAQRRVEANDWGNVSLVQADAVAFEFPSEADAILSTYALTQVPGCREVIAHGAASLSQGGHLAVLDLKVPDNAPRRLTRLGIATVRPFASIEEWTARRPWDAIRAAMETELTEAIWIELFFGTAFLAAGSR